MENITGNKPNSPSQVPKEPIPTNLGTNPPILIPVPQRPKPMLRVINPAPNYAYRCKLCPAKFPTPRALGGHASAHAKAKKFQARLAETFRERKRMRIENEAVMARVREVVRGNEPRDDDDEREAVAMDAAVGEDAVAVSDDESSEGSVTSRLRIVIDLDHESDGDDQ